MKKGIIAILMVGIYCLALAGKSYAAPHPHHMRHAHHHHARHHRHHKEHHHAATKTPSVSMPGSNPATN